MGCVHFRLSGKAVGLGFAPPSGETATLARGDIALTLGIELNEAGQETSDCLIAAQTVRTLTSDTYALFEERREAIRRATARLRERSSSKGVVALPPSVFWFDPPEPVAAICADIESELLGEATRLVQLLRWLGNRLWPADPLRRPELRWSLDGETWEVGPTPEDEFIPLGGPELELESPEFARIFATELAEPVARQILAEAVSAAEGNTRAGYILGFVAAEVGIKQFAVARGEGTSEAWLIENLQSPAMDRLLKNYVPRLTDKRTADGRTALPPALTRTLSAGMTKRNDLMHKNEPPPDERAVRDLLVAVNDLLYLLDWFAGHEWAFSHLTDETRAAYSSEHI